MEILTVAHDAFELTAGHFSYMPGRRIIDCGPHLDTVDAISEAVFHKEV